MEHVLALSRIVVALMSLAAWSFRFGASASRYQLGFWLLVAYTVTSVVLFVWLQRRGEPSRNFAAWAQVNDIGWPALLCFWLETPQTVFFVLFLFAIIAAGFRWGFVETVATAVVSSALLLSQALAVAHATTARSIPALVEVEPYRIVLRCGFLLILGTLVGFLGETEKELRAEIAFSNRLLSMARIGTRFSVALQNVLLELASRCRGSSVYDVVAQSSTGRAFKWEISSVARPAIRTEEIAPTATIFEMMSAYPHTFYMQRKGSSGACSVVALDEEGCRLHGAETRHLQMPLANAESVLAVSHEMGRDWRGRFVLVNAKLGSCREHKLRFLQQVLRQTAPALYSVYLFQAFRSRAGENERARVARELHDTSIQSLISIEMQLDVIRRRSSEEDSAAELGRIQGMLRNEVLSLRELMQSLRPVDIGPHQFLDFIAGVVERFSRDSGIPVRFISDLKEINLSAETCREVARVVQESLVNIRKHSRANSAVIRFGAQNGFLKVVINDDGEGFPFAGRFTLAELDRSRRGPVVIKERVRAVGGDLVIESTPGHGSRLEVTVPQKGHESYG